MYNLAFVVGSSRKESLNKKLAIALGNLGKDLFNPIYVDIDNLPMYNGDIELNSPDSVKNLKKTIEDCDCTFFVTPEYNRSIPPLLKNAIDWASRPYMKNSWSGKPAAMAGISVGAIGTAAAQAHLRNILIMLNMGVFVSPEVYLAGDNKTFTPEGNLSNEGTAGFLRSYLEGYHSWVKKILS